MFTLVQELLPPEYGLTTGFIAYKSESGKTLLSPQLDIRVYDAIRHSPPYSFGVLRRTASGAVYGCVEVKAPLTSNVRQSSEPELPGVAAQRWPLLRGVEHRVPAEDRLWCLPTQFAHRRRGAGDVLIRANLAVIDEFAVDRAVGRLDDQRLCWRENTAGQGDYSEAREQRNFANQLNIHN